MTTRDLVHLTCKEVVELVTDYQAGALDVVDRVTFEQHLFGCTWCMTYMKQVKRTIELTGQLKEPAPPPPADTQKLTALFRAWKKDT